MPLPNDAGVPPGRLLLETAPRDGRWNMAFDEALLEGAAVRGEAALRIYRWSEPTLSLGHFQKSLPADLPDALRSLPVVRRLSGGGAILHHHEWTYSVALPKEHPLAARAEPLYEAVHAALVAAFARSGATASLRGESLPDVNGRFLCYLRGDPRDIVVAGAKIVGSAQRRRRGAVLQHGSVLLRVSPLVPELPGLFDLVPGRPRSPLFAADAFVEEVGPLLFPNSPIEGPHPDDVNFARRLWQEVADRRDD